MEQLKIIEVTAIPQARTHTHTHPHLYTHTNESVHLPKKNPKNPTNPCGYVDAEDNLKYL